MAYLNRYILPLLFTGLILDQVFSAPDKNLSIDFLIEDSTQTISKKKVASKKNKKSFSKLIKELEKIDGLFTLYRDKKSNKAYISIYPDQLDF